MPLYEPHLQELFQRNWQEGRHSLASEAGHAGHSHDAIFLCAGTPPV